MLDEHIQSFPNKVNKTQHSVTVDTGLAGCRNSHPTLSAYMKSLGKSVSHTVLWHLRRAGVTTHDFFYVHGQKSSRICNQLVVNFEPRANK